MIIIASQEHTASVFSRPHEVKAVCCSRTVSTHQIIWCHNAEGRDFSVFWIESEVLERMVMMNSRFGSMICLVISLNPQE